MNTFLTKVWMPSFSVCSAHFFLKLNF
uniref:Uncharacterized protein n=1 Tax=Arundo donax TaxID=35708 RepID=A0A0A9E1Z8_ARUDO